MPKLIGGVLCLDFVNTVDPRHAAERHDYLSSYPALVAWACHAKVIGTAEGERLLVAASGAGAEARRVLDRAIGLREALYPVLAGAADWQPPARRDLDRVNGEVGAALGHRRVAWSAEGFAWDWELSEPALDRVLWPVALSAADLLAGGPLDRIRECPGGGNCGWLFLDISKNASRRWCDMRSCGNRAKVRRHYARNRASGTEPGLGRARPADQVRTAPPLRSYPGAGIGARLPGRPDLRDR
jgi:predicted RNA-binding Zn ribbon-like protein